jgi:hypothetical protein
MQDQLLHFQQSIALLNQAAREQEHCLGRSC